MKPTSAITLLSALLALRILLPPLAHADEAPALSASTQMRQQDFWLQGNPTLRQWARTLPAGPGTQAEPDLFGAPLLPGTAHINLRGAGSERTPVQLNGLELNRSPLPSSGSGGLFVNINQLPAIALQSLQTEDGAVDFSTRDNFVGTEIAYDFAMVEDSDGDEQLGLLWGTEVKTAKAHTSIVLAASAEKQATLGAGQRSWGRRNTDGSFAAPLPEQDCGLAGGNPAAGNCLLRQGTATNLVENEEHNSLLLRLRHLEQGNRGRAFRASLLWSDSEVGELLLPASWAWRFAGQAAEVPADNPAAADFMARNSASLADAQAAAIAGRASNATGSRPRGIRAHRDRWLSLQTDLGPQKQFHIDLHTGVSDALVSDPLVSVQRVNLALRGFGGANCDPLTGTAGQGNCEFYNPFVTGGAAALPAVNPATGLAYTPDETLALRNSRELDSWLVGQNEDRYLYRSTGWLLSHEGQIERSVGGRIEWQWGLESLRESWKQRLGALRGGAVFGGRRNEDDLFTDWNIPLGSNLLLNIGGAVDVADLEEMEPYLGLRWQSQAAEPTLTAYLNWSADGRRADLNQLYGQHSLPLLDETGAYTQLRVDGDLSLEEEEITHTALGLSLSVGNLSASVDLWQTELDGAVVYDRLITAADSDDSSQANPALQVTGYYNSGPATSAGNDLAVRYHFTLAEDYALSPGIQIATLGRFDIPVRTGQGETIRSVVGRLNASNWVQPIAETRIGAFVHFEAQRHSLLLNLAEDSGYQTDDGRAVASWTSADLHYRYRYRDNKTQLSLSVINLADENPPFAPVEIGYNAYTHPNRNSYIKIGFRHNY